MVAGATVKALFEVIASPFFGVGRLVGALAKLGAFCRDATIAGYRDGWK
jgi:hypothetical protein